LYLEWNEEIGLIAQFEEEESVGVFQNVVLKHFPILEDFKNREVNEIWKVERLLKNSLKCIAPKLAQFKYQPFLQFITKL
jgi:hypothetical protein